MDQVLDRLVAAERPNLISAFENKLLDLENQKRLLEEKITKSGENSPAFRQAFRTAFDFLASPWKLWASGRIEGQWAVLKLVFADHLAYCRKIGVLIRRNHVTFQGFSGFLSR